MSKLDDAMLEHMTSIVLSENRPFSYADFLSFSVGDEQYEMTHGTIRNKISEFKKQGQIELSYYSIRAFYTLNGHKFGKPMTPDHTVVHNNPVYKMLESIPFGQESIHDIRLRFKVPKIHQIFSNDPCYHKNKRSQDIPIPTWDKNKALVRTIIHKSDVVSVTIGCSLQPIPLNTTGIIFFFSLLVRVEEKLQTLCDNAVLIGSDQKLDLIPEYTSWIITMWHFGRDSILEYTGEKYCITAKSAQHILTRLYVKDFHGKKKFDSKDRNIP